MDVGQVAQGVHHLGVGETLFLDAKDRVEVGDVRSGLVGASMDSGWRGRRGWRFGEAAPVRPGARSARRPSTGPSSATRRDRPFRPAERGNDVIKSDSLWAPGSFGGWASCHYAGGPGDVYPASGRGQIRGRSQASAAEGRRSTADRGTKSTQDGAHRPTSSVTLREVDGCRFPAGTMLLKSKPTPRVLTTCVLAGVIAGGAVACRQPAPAPRGSIRSHDIKLPRELTTVASQVPANATLPEILATHRIRPEHGAKFLQALTGVFDVRDLKAHHPYQIELTLDGWLRAFRYQIDTDRFLQVSIPPAGHGHPCGADRGGVHRRGDALPQERALVAVRGTIDEKNNSLIAAMDAAGENIQLAIGLAEIFGGDIDFGHDLQPGDSFEVVFEQVVKEGARAGYGEIIAATFTNDGKTYSAFRYQVPGRQARLLRRAGAIAEAVLPRVTAEVRAARDERLLLPPPASGAGHPPPAPRCRLRRPEGRARCGRVRWHGRVCRLHEWRRQHGDAPSHRRYEPCQCLHLSSFGVGIRAGAPRLAGRGHRPRRLHRPGHGPHLHYVLKRNGRRQRRRRAPPSSARRPDWRRRRAAFQSEPKPTTASSAPRPASRPTQRPVDYARYRVAPPKNAPSPWDQGEGQGNGFEPNCVERIEREFGRHLHDARAGRGERLAEVGRRRQHVRRAVLVHVGRHAAEVVAVEQVERFPDQLHLGLTSQRDVAGDARIEGHLLRQAEFVAHRARRDIVARVAVVVQVEGADARCRADRSPR